MTNLTTFGQPSTPETVLITRGQQRNCLKCLINAPIKDSIIMVKDSIITLQRIELITNTETLKELDIVAYKSKNRAVKYKKQRNRVAIGSIFIGIAAFIFGLVI